MVGRPPDELRILRILAESEGALSNMYVRTELDFTDKKYGEVRAKLLDKKLIEKYTCRGGGVRLTESGWKEYERPSTRTPLPGVKRENELYGPLVDYLENQAEIDEVPAVIVNTSQFLKRGKWQNPDIMRISLSQYPILDRCSISISTYEIKRWGQLGVEAVYEAASHRRFSHYSILVVECPKGEEFPGQELDSKVEQIFRECQRFGIGLCTLRPYYTKYRLHTHIRPESHSPTDDELEDWLTFVFTRDNKAKTDFERLRSEMTNGQ